MTEGARTPDELDGLLEDAFVLRDERALTRLFDHGALVADTAGEARGAAEITRWASRRWDEQLSYVAEPGRIVAAGDLALLLSDTGTAVARCGTGRVWRYVILLPSLVAAPSYGMAATAKGG
jgi:hypothetical protein